MQTGRIPQLVRLPGAPLAKLPSTKWAMGERMTCAANRLTLVVDKSFDRLKNYLGDLLSLGS
jgi:hypothetical protein